jgi:hypothetical protein
MFYLSYLCLFVHSGVQHILCCVFALFFFVMLSVSLDCLFLIAPSVFSNVYLNPLSLLNFLFIIYIHHVNENISYLTYCFFHHNLIFLPQHTESSPSRMT